ncbi:hypothetical protein OWV82_009353 [Melia azedarach]|uniref:Uncharacterized protein n=1 Tax=Melia azedarach TaxID=155640 RepID=A0ACC1YEM9_MELAZ|nr:hypothetical protein OWV82_009353 [Melia azedarach]
MHTVDNGVKTDRGHCIHGILEWISPAHPPVKEGKRTCIRCVIEAITTQPRRPDTVSSRIRMPEFASSSTAMGSKPSWLRTSSTWV